MKRRVKKTRVLLLVFMIVALAMVAALAVVILSDHESKPQFLIEDELKGDFKANDYIYVSNNGLKATVFYPKENVDLYLPLAKSIAEDLKSIDIQDELLLKVDYAKSIINNQYTSLVYSFEVNGQYFEYYYLADENGQAVDQSVIDEFLLKQISIEARQVAKQDSKFAEVAFTKEFANATTYDNLNDFHVYLDENNLIIVFDDYYGGMPLTVKLLLNEVSEHVDLDLGINQTINVDEFRIPKVFVDSDKPMVALTFDDGPYTPRTGRIVDALYKNDANATFYVLGHRLPNEHKMVIDMLSLGNDIGSHSWNHPKLNKLSYDELMFQFNETNKYLNENIVDGNYEIKTFRTPYGASNKFVSENSPYPFIMWSVDTLDWQSKDADKVLEVVKNNVEDGSIILMHDIHETSVDAAIMVIDYLKQQGYQIVSVEDMFEAKGIDFTNGQTYSKVT